MADQQPRQPRVKTVLNDFNMGITGPMQQGGRFPAQFKFLFANTKQGHVVMQVDTKVQDAENYGKFEAIVPLQTAMGIIELIREVINLPNGKKRNYQQKDFIFIRGARSEEPKVKASVMVGKDEDGTMWMGLVAYNKPNIKFTFTLPNLDTVVDESNQEYSAAEKTVFAAKVFVSMYSQLLIKVIADNWTAPQRNGDGGNNGNQNRSNNNSNNSNNSNNNNNGNSGQSSNSTSNDFDTDVPW